MYYAILRYRTIGPQHGLTQNTFTYNKPKYNTTPHIVIQYNAIQHGTSILQITFHCHHISLYYAELMLPILSDSTLWLYVTFVIQHILYIMYVIFNLMLLIFV